jgi:NCS1 family nucleobase:cation symporter-1
LFFLVVSRPRRLIIFNIDSVFLGPMCGIQICDYFIVRSRKMKLSDLYSPSPAGIYYYFHGVNPRAFVAWVCGWAPQLPGFVGNVNKSVTLPKACTEMFYLAFPLGLAISFTIYLGLNKVFPPKGLGEYDDVDYYGTFTGDEAMKLGVSPLEKTESTEKKEEVSYSIDEKAMDAEVTAM